MAIVIVIFSIVIFILCYIKSEEHKLTRAVICSALINIIGFAGPYVVEWMENKGRERQTIIEREQHVGEDNVDIDVEAEGHQHDWTYEIKENVVEANCIESGSYVLVACCECGEKLIKETIDVEPLGHNYKKTVTPAVCEDSGFTTYKCTRCEDTYIEDEVEALGHNYSEGICVRCKSFSPDYEGIVASKANELVKVANYNEALSVLAEAIEVIDSESLQQLYNNVLAAKQAAEAATIYTAYPVNFCVYNGSIDGEDETDTYSMTAPVSGIYRFDMSEMVNGFLVKLFVYDSAGNKMGGYSGVSNGHGANCTLEKDKEYFIKVSEYSETGNYILTVGQQKETVDATHRDVIYDSIEYVDQCNKYTFVPTITGNYRFDVCEMVNGFQIGLHVYDSLGYKVAGYNGVGNESGVTAQMSAGETYTIKITEYSNLGNYKLTIGRQLPIQDISGKNSFVGEIAYKDQENEYTYIPNVSGEYKFELKNIANGFEVALGVYDALGYKVAGYGGVGNGSIINGKLNAGETYTIRVEHYNNFGSYEIAMYKE